jgi:four helix bundle protein
MQDFRKFAAWQRAQVLAVEVYRATDGSLAGDASGLRRQVRDAALSIGANIAEGARAGTRAQFAKYLQIAIASCSEVESHLDLGGRLGAIAKPKVDALVDEVVQIRRMTFTLRKRVLAGDGPAPPGAPPAGTS